MDIWRDPFFKTRKPHNKPYLESLHTTYGAPRLPGRSNEAFQRALQFRDAEKTRYSALEADNARLHTQMNEMQGEAAQIQSLWEQLSKQQLHAVADTGTNSEQLVSERGGERWGSGGVPTGRVRFESPERVDQRPETGGARDPGGGVAGDAQSEREGEVGDGAGVQREVLPAVLPDPRGHPGEHTSEGPEQRDGPEHPQDSADDGDRIREDKA